MILVQTPSKRRTNGLTGEQFVCCVCQGRLFYEEGDRRMMLQRNFMVRRALAYPEGVEGFKLPPLNLQKIVLCVCKIYFPRPALMFIAF